MRILAMISFLIYFSSLQSKAFLLLFCIQTITMVVLKKQILAASCVPPKMPKRRSVLEEWHADFGEIQQSEKNTRTRARARLDDLALPSNRVSSDFVV